MKKLLAIIPIIFFVYYAAAQGCVAIRANGNTCSMAKPGDEKGWSLNFNNRYFKSYKHFVGTEEQKHRVEEGTEVINHAFAWDFTLAKSLNKYWSVAVAVPVLSNVRSSLYEHGGNSAGYSGRHSTRSFGLGDVRFTAYRWLLDPAKGHKGNIQAGLGLKLATGDYRVQDFFIKSDGSQVLGPVDQSIQLGDGGTGFITELNGYYNFSHNLGAYANFYYLINPREQNGVSTARGATPSSTALQYFTSTMSVPDQYMARTGVNYMLNQFTYSGGARIDCIHSND